MQRLAGSGSGGQGLVRMTLFSTRPCIEKNCTIRIIGQYSTIITYCLICLHSGPENLKESRPKKLVKSNKSISRKKIFLTKIHFLQFQKWPKINF